MKKRVNERYESYKSLRESRLQLAAEEQRKINEAAAQRENFMNQYDIIRSMKKRKEADHARLMEAARDDALAKSIKAIYISALEADTLTDDALILAEHMVDKWIKDNGGASAIFNSVGESTYLISRLMQIVEDAAEADVAEVEAPDEDDEPSEEGSRDVQIAQLTAKEAEIKAKIANLKADKKAEEEGITPKTDDEEAESQDANEDNKDAVVDNDADEEIDIDIKPENDEEKKAEEQAPEEPAEAEKTEDEKSEDTSDDEEAPASDEGGEAAPAQDPEEATEEPESNDDEDEDVGIELDEELPEEDKAGEPVKGADDADPTADVDGDGDSEDFSDFEDTDEDEEIIDNIDDPDLNSKDEDNGQDVDITVDGDTDNDGEIFNDLDKEEDIQKAIDLIRTRVADAEETFIRNNAEDKKRVDELINKISTNVKAVEDLSANDTENNKHEKEKAVATESIRENKQRINDVRDNRPLSVFEKMTRKLTTNIVTNESTLPNYTSEDGTLDASLVIESAKVMYAFLETLNTIQLAKVDEKYILNVIEGMK